MNISAATLLASQSALTTPKPSASGDTAGDFAPLLFKKTAPAPAQVVAAAPQASAPRSAPLSTATAPPAPGIYQRPGSTIDIKV